MEQRQRLGDMLIEQGKITESDLIKALEYQKIHRLRLGEVLVEWNLIGEDELLTILSDQLNVPYLRETQDIKINQNLVEHVPPHMLKANMFIPLKYGADKQLEVLCNDVYNNNITELCVKLYKTEPQLLLASKANIITLLNEYEREKNRIESLSKVRDGIKATVNIFDLNEKDDSPTVTLVNYILLNAYRRRASDIHLTQEEDQAVLQYRIDGILQLIDAYPIQKSGPLISRLKNMSGVSSTEKRRPQDGGFQAIAEKDTLDIRLSTMPTIYGESVVIRLLDRKYIDTLTINALGFTERNKDRYLSLLENPNGIIIITGPVGSGKTSTVYVSMKILNTGKVAINSIEDPVEYKMSGVIATPINEKAGVNFQSGMRALVRQDPDIIYVGEIRDNETAGMAINASNTGHLVISTLHTNDSVSAVSRLLNLGIKPYQLIDALLGTTAQVLVRKICIECGGDGCSRCDGSGYYGRIPLQEVMVFSPRMKEAIMQSDNIYKLREIALSEGLVPLIDDGMEKVRQGLTTMEEVLRVARKTNIA